MPSGAFDLPVASVIAMATPLPAVVGGANGHAAPEAKFYRRPRSTGLHDGFLMRMHFTVSPAISVVDRNSVTFFPGHSATSLP